MTDQSKPSTSQSCEHDKGTIWRTETGNGGFGVCSKVVPCPFCKPTAVEPEKKTICSHDDMPLDAQICPDCGWLPYWVKPVAVEPSVESMLRARIKELEGRLIDQAVTICEISKVFAKKLAELERKE